jgi:HEAT repeat protein
VGGVAITIRRIRATHLTPERSTMNADIPRTAARRKALATLVLLALLPATAAAQPAFYPDRPALSERVEKVRQALQQFGPEPDMRKKAQEELDRSIRDLRGVIDLGHALVLPEWSAAVIAPEIPATAGREKIARDFEKALGDALGKGDATRRCAALTLMAEMTIDEKGRQRVDGDPLLRETLGRLLEKVGALSRSDDAGVREAVARALGRTALEPNKIVVPLEKLLRDREVKVKRAAAEALMRQARGGDTPPGKLGPRERFVETTLEACAAVARVAARGLDDPDEQVSRQSAEAIKQAARGASGAVRAREQALWPERFQAPAVPVKPAGAEGGEPPARPWQAFRPAASALGDAVAWLRPLLHSDKAGRRVQGCQVVEAIAETRAQMLRVTSDKGALAKALGGTQDPLLAGLKEVVKDLADCADHKDVEVRLAALYVLEELGPEAAPAARATAKAMADEDSFVRWAAARVLGKMAPEEAKTAVPALASRVGDDNGDVRITALAALERYRAAARPAVKEVSQALKGGDEQTRLWAVRVLTAVGPEGREETTEPLIGALSAKEPAIRRAAVTALARFDKPDQKTRAALRAALADDDGEVRRTASEALLAE